MGYCTRPNFQLAKSSCTGGATDAVKTDEPVTGLWFGLCQSAQPGIKVNCSETNLTYCGTPTGGGTTAVPGPRCDTSGGRCYRPCTTDAECPAGSIDPVCSAYATALCNAAGRQSGLTECVSSLCKNRCLKSATPSLVATTGFCLNPQTPISEVRCRAIPGTIYLGTCPATLALCRNDGDCQAPTPPPDRCLPNPGRCYPGCTANADCATAKTSSYSNCKARATPLCENFPGIVGIPVDKCVESFCGPDSATCDQQTHLCTRPSFVVTAAQCPTATPPATSVPSAQPYPSKFVGNCERSKAPCSTDVECNASTLLNIGSVGSQVQF
ncbi:hypothetical protein A3D73_01885 [Candidatus Uhrbacteria bacterium RIFCSPHIGHO2_02_FULL_60_44]|nr:MAG: hypothetical protein A3D73_01885 [Candidatus Uhrbacteria bacterium RIFCSPHIGHO2_02_FULL_60_44]